MGTNIPIAKFRPNQSMRRRFISAWYSQELPFRHPDSRIRTWENFTGRMRMLRKKNKSQHLSFQSLKRISVTPNTFPEESYSLTLIIWRVIHLYLKTRTSTMAHVPNSLIDTYIMSLAEILSLQHKTIFPYYQISSLQQKGRTAQQLWPNDRRAMITH